jgi:hypothetical protein
MTPSPIHSLILAALREVTPERLQKAVCGLCDGSLTITLTRQTEAEIRALVKNGDGKEYGVTLTEALTACSCKDSLYRGVTCKHAVALALHVLRTPQEPDPLLRHDEVCPGCEEMAATLAPLLLPDVQAGRWQTVWICRECFDTEMARRRHQNYPGTIETWPGQAEPVPAPKENGARSIHLAHAGGSALCGEQKPERFWQHGYWPAELSCWPDACAGCETARRRPAVRPDLALVKARPAWIAGA